MYTSIIFTLFLCIRIAAISERNIEHTPFHKRDAKTGRLLDVREDRVKLAENIAYEVDGSVSVKTNVTLIKNGDPVRISWSNPNAGLFDMITLSTPPTRNVSDYLDYRYTADTVSTGTGEGYFNEMLFNMRQDYIVRYLEVDKATKTVTVKATCLVHVHQHEPMHGHIAVTENAGEMRVMWNSDKVDKPYVSYSLYPDLRNAAMVSANSRTYGASDLCGARANISNSVMFIDPGYLHDAVLTGLKSRTRYYYSYGSSGSMSSGSMSSGSMSSIASFVTGPSLEEKVLVTKFIGYGDMGVNYPPYVGEGSPGASRVSKLLNFDVNSGFKPEFILHFGDISYARGRGYIWDQYMTVLTNVSSQVPYMVGVGNHEYDHTSGGSKDPSGAPENGFHPSWGNYGDDGGGECGVPTAARYIAPATGNLVFWYSFDYGLIHVVMFSSEHDFRPGSRQFTWMEEDLKKVDRSRTPWVVVTSHRPLYTSQEQPGDHIVGLHMRLALEELFYTYSVNLHLSGHYHSYESTCAVVSGDCVPDGTGTVYVVVGTAGKSLEEQEYMKYNWSKYQNCNTYGYQQITANTTHLVAEYITAPNGQVLDTVVLKSWNHPTRESVRRRFKKDLDDDIVD